MSALWQDAKPLSVYLVGKRPPLAKYPALYRWLARWLYQRMHWCPEWGVEYQGVFTNEAEARHAASAPGMFYMELPLDAELPAQPCAYGVHDYPHSEASSFYRRRQMPYTAIQTEYLQENHREIRRLRDLLSRTEQVH